ncbi:phosphotransferase [Mycolicibacterium sp. CBMA 234]|uniref:phosphotransferase n=1 Tax=Mycolicibacterium sp. CBMA 234 TaxID=1918495 RepID=UPI0012DE558E|nr:phosphotransferase [Mycolicibacterium sp. CBMA 234]
MSAVLAPHFPDADVAQVVVTAASYGSACRAMLAIDYHARRAGPHQPPRSAVLKMSLSGQVISDAEMPGFWFPTMSALNSAEVRFYRGRQGAAALGDRIPESWYAQEESGITAVLIEDLRQRRDIRFGSFDKPLDRDAMAQVLEVLARLHAARWADPALAAAPLPDGLQFGMLDGLLSEENWAAQLSRPRGARVPTELSDHQRIANAFSALNSLKQDNPVCLLHGDPHIGNIFFDNVGAGLFDWQLFSSGHWAYDVVWAMVGAMTIEDRRANERDLLAHYLGALAGCGVEEPDFDSAWKSYRTFAIAGFLNFLTPGDTVQTEEYNAEVGARHATAAVDLDALRLLGV